MALLCLSLALWSFLPSSSHAPMAFEILHEHLEEIAAHGHSHGMEDDLYWALHGHSHDRADHDHGQALLAIGDGANSPAAFSDVWRLRSSPDKASRIFRIERPPRA
jgi:hypothetical protein